MKVTITSPIFKCREDEQVFLSQLRAVPGFEQVTGMNNQFVLALASDEAAFPSSELQALCNRWNTQFQLQSR